MTKRYLNWITQNLFNINIIMKIKTNSYWLKDEDIIVQIRNEYEQGLESVQAKRKIRENDLKNYYVPSTKKDKVNINSIYTTMQTLLSVYYADKMTVKWEGRKASNTGVAEALNRVCEFDYWEMGLDKLFYQREWDRFFFGVGIVTLDWWNGKTSTPVASVRSPLSWIPDPRGWVDSANHRWAWFVAEDTFANLTNNKSYFNTDLINSASGEKQEEIRQAYTSGRSVTDQGFEQVANKKYSIYHHYTCIDWYKYLVTLANERSLIIRMTRLEPMTKEEKVNPLLVPFPVVLKYFSPIQGDPFGISIPDLQRDKQTAESKIFNLAVIKETRNTLGEDIFYKSGILTGKHLTTQSVNPKAIPLKLREDQNIGNLIYRLPKEQSTNSAFNVGSQLQFQTSLSTWLDSNALGITAETGWTATEAQITQKNANLRFILGTKVGKWGEESFWKIYLRAYKFNLSPRSKKDIYIGGAFGSDYFSFRKRDFISNNEQFDVKIISNSEKESLMQKQKADFFGVAPQLLADPALPEVSKSFIKRKMLRLSGISEEEVYIMQPKSIAELSAELDARLVSENEKPATPKPWEDHLTYIYVLLGAKDTEAKLAAIEERKKLFIEEGGNQQQLQQAGDDWTLGNIAASNASQQTSANIAENLNWVPSNPWI